MENIGLRMITGVKWYKGLFDVLNNMTFIYDVNWNPNNSPKATFPVCFFHVKSCHEVMSSEISQKQMLFYNSSIGANDSDPSASSGLLNVVSDNIVIKPKVYKLELIIPYKNLSLLDQSFVYNTHTAQAVAQALIGKDLDSTGANQVLGSFATMVQPYTKLVVDILKSLINISYSFTTQEWIENVLHTPDYNKESLEIMWRMRHIVKMKMWNSWRYKYVAIQDIDITKEGTEDGVYEATLTVQEMPIVSMHAEGIGAKPTFEPRNPNIVKRGEEVISILNYAGGVMSEKEKASEVVQ